MQSSLMLPNGLSVTWCKDNHDHCVHLRGEPDYKTETCEINTLHQAQPRAAVEKHWRPQSSHAGTSVIQLRQGPNLRISAHVVFTVTEEHEGKATQLTNLVSRQRCGTHICGIRRGVHLLECQSLVRDRLEPQSSQPHMFRRNTVAATPRVIHDALTVRSNDDNTTRPEDPQFTLNHQRARALRDC